MHALPRRHHPQRKRRRRNDICNGPTKHRSACRACSKHCCMLFGSLAVAAAAAAAGAGRSSQQPVPKMCLPVEGCARAMAVVLQHFRTFYPKIAHVFFVVLHPKQLKKG